VNEPRCPVNPGDVIRVSEPDYMYGVGPLILRVTEVGSVHRHNDGAWLDLMGFELRADRSQVQPQPRYALVRLTALRHRSQPPKARDGFDLPGPQSGTERAPR
jgi:hypothetical protein